MPSQAPPCVLSASLTFMDVLALLAAAIARASSSFQRDNRAMAHGSGGQAAPARSKTAYMAIARIDGRRQRHRNAMSSMRIVHLLRTPPASKSHAAAKIFRWRGGIHAEIASVRSLTGGKRRSGTALLQGCVCACLGRKASMMAFAPRIARRPIWAIRLAR